MEGSEQSLVSSHAIDRPRCTDRQLLGFTSLLASCRVLGTRRGFVFVGGWGSGLEIPRLVSLARDDSYIESLGFRSDNEGTTLCCSQNVIR